MASSTWIWILVTAILCLAHEASCTDFKCGKGVLNKAYAVCKELPALGASLAWTRDSSTNSIHFAFTEDMQDSSGWVAWGINMDRAEMAGTQALAAFRNSTGVVTVRTYDITGQVKIGSRSLVPGPVSVAYSNFSAVMATTTVTIYGTLNLAAGQSLKLNHVWNRGSRVVAATSALSSHPVNNVDNLQSAAVIDMSTGDSSNADAPHRRLKQIHGLINASSWGILLPIGVMAARYLRPFKFADPLWFYLHAGCQLTGYAGGVAGWALGLRLQSLTNSIKYKHRNLGIAIFALATFQVLAAALLRPKRGNKLRPYWNVVHHTVGYATIIIIIINIFEGLKLLGEGNWRRIYITIIAILGLIAIALELITWFAWFQKRDRKHKHHSVLVGDT